MFKVQRSGYYSLGSINKLVLSSTRRVVNLRNLWLLFVSTILFPESKLELDNDILYILIFSFFFHYEYMSALALVCICNLDIFSCVPSTISTVLHSKAAFVLIFQSPSVDYCMLGLTRVRVDVDDCCLGSFPSTWLRVFLKCLSCACREIALIFSVVRLWPRPWMHSLVAWCVHSTPFVALDKFSSQIVPLNQEIMTHM